MIRSTRCLAIAVISLIAAGCHKKVQPVRPAPIVLPPSEPQPTAPPPNLPPAPKVGGQSPQSQTPAPPVSVEVKPPPPAPPAPKKAGRTPSKKGGEIKAENRAPDLPKPEPGSTKPETGETAQPSAVPALGEILSPEQAQEFKRRFDAALERSKNALLIIETKSLNSSQKQTAARIRGFIAQALQARQQDIANAASLAERADVISKDLLSRLR